MRGDRKKQEERGKGKVEDEVVEDGKIIDTKGYRPERIPQLMWRECIKKVWEVDPLVCPKCTGEMRIISFIYKKKVIKKILTHLNVYEERKNQRAPPLIKNENTKPVVVIVPCDDGWPE